MQPIYLPQMKSINSQTWQKAASFGTLFDTVFNLVDAHSVADVISLVSSELPIDTSAAYQESQSASKDILDEILNVNNLEPVSFLTSDGKAVSMMDFPDLEKRPTDVTFVKFRCNMDVTALDKRVQSIPRMSFIFCLKLPVYEYDSTAKTATRIDTPPSPTNASMSSVSRSLMGCFTASTPGTPTGTANTTTSAAFSSPAMTTFMSSRTASATTKRGYYGPCDFLDNQLTFHSAFGVAPAILSEDPNDSKNPSRAKFLREFGDTCKLDIFLYLCQLNYVGHSKVDTTMNTQEVCSSIGELRQNYTHSGQPKTDTPEELFNKFTALTVNLPDNATTWSIQLCSTYFSALNKELVENMTTDTTFKMPDLTTLTSKALQLEALRSVRNQATKSFKVLKKQKDLMSKMLRSLQTGNRGENLFLQSDRNVPHNSIEYGSSLQFQQSQSSAEFTMSKYDNGKQQYQGRNNGTKVETRLCRDTGLQHPYDKENDYLSRFPEGFRGCFNCGKTDHFRTGDCQLAQSGKFDKKKFFLELWAHKPHTKISNRDTNGNQNSNNQGNLGNNTGQNFNMQHNNNDNCWNTGSNTWNMGSQNSNSRDQNATGNAGSIHFNGHNNNRYTGQNTGRNMGMNNTSNPNAFGNDGCEHFNANNNNDQDKKNDLTRYQNNKSTRFDRDIDNTPAWMKKKDTPSKKARMFTLSGSLLNIASADGIRPMPLALDNGLPAAVLRFGTSSEDEIPFSCHLDSCAAMNTGSLHLHQWVCTQHPHLVANYEQFDDKKPFRPITLDCAVPQSEAEKTTGKLTAVITYKTRYRDNEGQQLTLSFGLGAAIRVNAIIGLPTLRKWKMVLDIDGEVASSKLLNCYFDLQFEHAATGFPKGIVFDPNTFRRPNQNAGTGLALLAQAAAADTISSEDEKTENGITINIENSSE